MNEKEKEIITEEKTFWILKREELERIEETNVFQSNCCYVVRWQLRVQIGGERESVP